MPENTLIRALHKILILPVLIFLVSCSSKRNAVENFHTVDKQKLEAAFAAAGQFSNLKCLIVSQNGSILQEVFYGNSGPDIPHDVRSVTKSVTSLLFGIAKDKGITGSEEQTIAPYFRNLYPGLPEDKANIKVRDILTMSGGFTWNEMSNVSEYNKWITSANQVKYVLDRPLNSQPGTVFNYNSAALHLLSVIITEASKTPTQEFARKYLFTPMELSVTNWETDKQGYNNGGAGLQLTPYDMLKIGELYLNGGTHKKERIVSAEWISNSIKTHISTGNSEPYGTGYGYCWWTGQSSKGNYAFANGWGGQFILIVPNLNVVIVATNEWKDIGTSTANAQWSRTMDLIVNHILAAFN
ncbi:MAG: serine hydrolase [Bacteroidota bacterium]|nr:serine hydrolase [Bacteroidota bacterium]